MKKATFLLLTVSAIFGSSCKKLEACLDSDITTAKLGQEIEFTNCSENHDDANLDLDDGNKHFDMGSSYDYAYHTVGNFDPTLVAEKKNEPEEASVDITIESPTNEEITQTWLLTKSEYVSFGSATPNATFSTLPDTLIINADGTSNEGDWQLNSDGSFSIGNEQFLIHKLYNNELEIKQSWSSYYSDDVYDIWYYVKQ